MNEETIHTIALTRIKGLGHKGALALYKEVGSASGIFSSINESSASFLHHATLYNLLKEGMKDALDWAQREAEYCEKRGIRCLCLNNEDYPTRLRQCADAPLVLYYMGNADLNTIRMVAMVGTRHCTEYGKDLCCHITEEMRGMNPKPVIVSGLAYGIDIHAHRGAMDASLPTVAVLAHGLDRIYPLTHRETAKKMLQQGGLLTEYPAGTTPERGNFLARNRIIAGMTDATIVVESAIKGGAMVTGRLAFEYGRMVFACPGRVSDTWSEGCNELIRKNVAAPLIKTKYMMEDLGWKDFENREAQTGRQCRQDLFGNLDEESKKVVECLTDAPDEGLLVSQIAQTTGMRVQQVSAVLFDLEMEGLVKLMPGGMYRPK